MFVVHRIDRDTSGLVCYARNEAAHRHLSIQFTKHTVRKLYQAVVKGKFPYKESIIDSPIAENPRKLGTMMVTERGKEAVTICRIVQAFKHSTLLEVEIKTGRTHQIRVHLASVGYPLLVDEIYGGNNAFYFSSLKRNYKQTTEEERPTISRQTLHASTLSFIHPSTGKEVTFSLPLPKDMEVLLKLLRKYDV